MKTLKNLFLITVTIILITYCKKEDPSSLASLSTTDVTSITGLTAISGGNITKDGGATVTARGVCWSTSANPTITQNYQTSDGSGIGSFTSNIDRLNAGTTYHIRAYATNSVGTVYGNDLTFTTLGGAPTITTLAASYIFSTSATLNGSAIANYLSTTITFDYGTTTNYGKTATTTESGISGNTLTNVSAKIEALTVGTVYHYRLKGVNSKGTTYGNDMSFITPHSRGDIYQGGIIFYITGTYPNQHGLVCAESNQSTGIRWWNGSYVTTGATGIAIGTGQANTTAIVAAQGVGNYAAKLCDDLVLNGYSDWFLPSKDELDLMYFNFYYFGYGGFSTDWYWSSSEYDSSNAWEQFFYNTGSQNKYDKNFPMLVRAVRAF